VSAYHRNSLPAGTQLAEYAIDSVLGHGGFGITYLAHDTTLEAKVAIKEYLPHQIAQRDDKTGHVLPQPNRDAVRDYHWGLKNFVKEARALAQFKHPHIVRVLRFFEANGTAYMVMEYEEGQSLAQYLKRQGPRLDEAMLLRIFIPILNGLHAVHEAKMLHLDIKPENIYIRADGSPMLIDFGSARQAIATQSHGQRVALTYGYAPIEQYPDKGQQGPWTDVYALGASMYRCVTGKKPGDALERYQTVLKYKADPLTPATKAGKNRYQASLLECIDWAMQIYPKDRPQSARELQDSLMGKGRTAQQPRRHVAPANFSTSAARTAPAYASARGPAVRVSSRPGTRRRSTSGFLILIFAGVIGLAAYLYGPQWLERETTPVAEPEGKAAPRLDGVSGKTDKPVPVAAAVPSPPAARSTLPVVAAQTLTGHGDWVTSVAIAPDGRWLVSGSNDKSVRVWDLSDGALLGTLRGHTVVVNSVAVSPDGQWIASASNDGTVRVWDVKTGETRHVLRGYGHPLFSVAFSPDARRVISAGRDRTIFVWEVVSGKRLLALEGHKGDVNTVAFSPDGQQIASSGADRTIRIWNAQTGVELNNFGGHKDPVLSLAYSADGQWLASGDAGGTTRVWETRGYSHERTIASALNGVLSLSFSRDGRWLAAGTADRLLRILNPQDGSVAQVLDGHEGYVHSVSFAADDSLLASGGRDRSIRLWKPAN
jgi:serine/threonine protein kinase